MKIRSKIIVSILLVVLISGGATLLFATRLSQEALKDSIGSNSSTLAKQTLDSVDRIIYRRIERWQSFIETRPYIFELLKESNQEFQALDNRQEIIALRDNQWISASDDQAKILMTDWINAELSDNLQSVVRFYETEYSYTLFPEVFITNEYGLNVAQTNRTSDYNQADEEWWQLTKSQGIYVLDTSFDESAQIYSLSFCIRIDDEDGNFLGVMKVVYNLEEIISIIDEVENDPRLQQSTGDASSNETVKTAVVFNLIDAKGRLIYSTKNTNDQPLQKVSSEILNVISSKGSKKYFTYFNDEVEEEELYSFANSSGYRDYAGLGWMFVLQYKTSEVYLSVYTLARNLIFVIVGGSILAIIVGLIISKFITNPIEQLGKSLGIIKKGDYSHKAEIKTKDEIGDFSRAFDQMIMAIKESRRDIDKKVDDQTKEITKQRDAIKKQMKNVEKYANDLKKFQLAVDNASDHIIITDAEGIVLYANQAVRKITGYTPQEVIGTKAGKLWRMPMPHEYYVELWDIVKKKKKVFSGEIQNKRKNGEKYIAHINISPVLNNKGCVLFIIGIERDITKEKQIDKAKTEFVSLASHQLRTPLSAINWYAEMLMAGDVGKLTKAQQDFMKEIYTGNKRMVDLVNSLLNVSRIELGTFAIEPKNENIQKLAKVIVKELQPQIKKKKIKFKKKISKEIPIMSVDAKLISIIFQNLLSNAIKYTPEKGSVYLQIERDKKNLIVIVSDTGCGIPKPQQSKIFSKLFRADNVQSKDTEGTGLGLYIIKSILNQSGGRISFTSEENKGTTFTVKIPLSGMKQKRGTKGLSAG